MTSGQHEGSKLQEGVEDLLTEEKPVGALTQARHAAKSQPASGQPLFYSQSG